jgi:hypothetical protein
MQLTLGRVHREWCVFPLHNECLTQTFANHRFLMTIILSDDSWTLIIILWLNPKTFLTQHLIKRHDKSLRRHRLRRGVDHPTTWVTFIVHFILELPTSMKFQQNFLYSRAPSKFSSCSKLPTMASITSNAKQSTYIPNHK